MSMGAEGIGDMGDFGSVSDSEIAAALGIGPTGDPIGANVDQGFLDDIQSLVQGPFAPAEEASMGVGNLAGMFASLLGLGFAPAAVIGLLGSAMGVPSLAQVGPEGVSLTGEGTLANAINNLISDPAGTIGQGISDIPGNVSDFVGNISDIPGDALESLTSAQPLGKVDTVGSGGELQRFNPIEQLMTELFGQDTGQQFTADATIDPSLLIPGLRQELLDFAGDTQGSDFSVPRRALLERQEGEGGEEIFSQVGLAPFEDMLIKSGASDTGQDVTQTFRHLNRDQYEALKASNLSREQKVSRITGDIDRRDTGFADLNAAIDAILQERGLEGQGFGAPARAFGAQLGQTAPINRGVDLTQRLSGDVGTELINQSLLNATNQRRGSLQTEAEGLFGADPFDFAFDDDLITSILDAEQNRASTELANQFGRGNLNPTGSRLANEALLAQRPGAQERLTQIGESQLGQRNELFDPIRQGAFSAAQGFELGQDFSFEPFQTQADEFRTTSEGSLEGDIRTQLGGEQLFNPMSAFQAGAGGQGLVSGGASTNAPPSVPTGTPSDGGGSANLLSAIAGREGRRVDERGLRNAGSGRF